ncbi:LacI family DNA-binding transcriptional regulator [Priestia aryabhattai]|uniref:LacI family DNA-binding transcriptional regulator n=1 Tax=Priestia aryabhattai TaxID=412384 RepID=UPI003D2C06E6
MKPTIRDVAKVAGVSTTTVSRVLNNRGYISKKTRASVYTAINNLNYLPNDLARSLFQKRTNFIGLLVPNASDPFFGELTFEVQSFCASLDYKIILCNTLNHIDKESKYLETLFGSQVDGLIMSTHNPHVLNNCEQNLPIVTIDHYISKKIPLVSSDHYSGSLQAIELLISKGCQHIIYVSTYTEFGQSSTLKRNAYEDGMKRQGKRSIIYEYSGYEEKCKVIYKLFDENTEVDGIFCSDDITATAVITEAKKRGISIPNHLKVIGYNGTEISQILCPGLTTVQQPIDLIAKTAVKSLLEAIDGKVNTNPTKFYLPMKIMEGTTT